MGIMAPFPAASIHTRNTGTVVFVFSASCHRQAAPGWDGGVGGGHGGFLIHIHQGEAPDWILNTNTEFMTQWEPQEENTQQCDTEDVCRSSTLQFHSLKLPELTQPGLMGGAPHGDENLLSANATSAIVLPTRDFSFWKWHRAHETGSTCKERNLLFTHGRQNRSAFCCSLLSTGILQEPVQA